MVGPLLARLRRFVRGIAAAHSSPERLALACVVGGIVGATPFFGLHLPICLALAWALRLNGVAVYAAANISIPPLAPFLAFACIEVGARVLTGHAVPTSPAALRAVHPWALAHSAFVAWMVGSPIVGGAIGAALGAVVYPIARARGTRHPVNRPVNRAGERASDPWTMAVSELETRFARSPIGVRQYVKWKVRLDPVYRLIADRLPNRAVVVDLGAGLAVLPILLALLGTHRRVVAVDHDESKVREGARAAVGLPVEVFVGDVRTWSPPACDVIVIVDVLHYFDVETQRAILDRAVGALREGGTLFIREADRASDHALGGGGAWTRFLERVAVRIAWNRAEGTWWRPIAEVVDDLRAREMSVEATVASGRLHPGNALVRAVKLPAPRSRG